MPTISNVSQSLDVPSFIVTLSQAAAAFREDGERPNAQAVIAAMLDAEKAAKQRIFSEGLSHRSV